MEYHLAFLMREEHVTFNCRNEAAMDESLLSAEDEDIERRAIEEIAGISNADENMSVSLCRGMCLREKGRNACPCKGIGQFCASACHPDNTLCWNRCNVQSDTDYSSESSNGETHERKF